MTTHDDFEVVDIFELVLRGEVSFSILDGDQMVQDVTFAGDEGEKQGEESYLMIH